jgi:hypothetical protein
MLLSSSSLPRSCACSCCAARSQVLMQLRCAVPLQEECAKLEKERNEAEAKLANVSDELSNLWRVGGWAGCMPAVIMPNTSCSHAGVVCQKRCVCRCCCVHMLMALCRACRTSVRSRRSCAR